MTEPTPLSAEELAELRDEHNAAFPWNYEKRARLLATLDAAPPPPDGLREALATMVGEWRHAASLTADDAPRLVVETMCDEVDAALASHPTPSGTPIADLTGIDAIEHALIERLRSEGWQPPSGTLGEMKRGACAHGDPCRESQCVEYGRRTPTPTPSGTPDRERLNAERADLHRQWMAARGHDERERLWRAIRDNDRRVEAHAAGVHPAAPSLDVEALAGAIAVCLGRPDMAAWRADPTILLDDLPVIPHDLEDAEEWYASPNEMAARIAREYQRITGQ